MSTERPSVDGKYYTDTEIAKLLGISLGRLRNKLCAGSPLPPRIQPPGCRTRLWPSQAVHDWLEQFTITVADPVTLHAEPRNKSRVSPKAVFHVAKDSEPGGATTTCRSFPIR